MSARDCAVHSIRSQIFFANTVFCIEKCSCCMGLDIHTTNFVLRNDAASKVQKHTISMLPISLPSSVSYIPRFSLYSAEAGCSLVSFENGIINLGSSDGQFISFKCYPGYRLVGSEVLSCSLGDNGNQWNEPMPICEKSEYSFILSPMFSNFETVLSICFTSACFTSSRPVLRACVISASRVKM